MFYLTTQSKHFIYGYIASDIIMVKDHSNSQRENTLPPLHGLLFPISSKDVFYMHYPKDRIAHTTTFVCYSSGGALAGTRNGSMGPP